MKKIFTNIIKLKISACAGNNDIPGIITILEKYLKNVKNIKTSTNEYYMEKFLNWLKYGGKLPHSVFTIGNKKLPFLSFSTLPAVTCSGAGICLDYCYSFKAWRQPAAFFRQVQNTLLMANFDVIKQELNKTLYLKNGNFRKQFKDLNKIDFSLYVDGDFSTEKDILNCMELLKEYPYINSYGYSKSLHLFLKLHDENYKFPANYILNLSNGGLYDQLMPILQDLYFTRGKFTAVKISKGENIRDKFNNKIFICPGNCGKCTNKGHACGNMDIFNNMEIVIPVH